jgi:hypothetical protein
LTVASLFDPEKDMLKDLGREMNIGFRVNWTTDLHIAGFRWKRGERRLEVVRFGLRERWFMYREPVDGSLVPSRPT